jgi:hypothetical protein
LRFRPGLTETPEQITIVDEDGNVRRGINWHLTPEEYQQVKEGYRCLSCMEPFQTPFPEKCGICGFHVQAQQSFELVRQHQGELDMGPSPAMRQVEEEREKELWTPSGTTQIWLP